MIFVSESKTAEALCKDLWAAGIHQADRIYGKRTQNQRTDVLRRFRYLVEKKLLLVEVDIASMFRDYAPK